MKKLCVAVFFASVALAAILDARGIETNGALGFTIFFTGLASIQTLTRMISVLLTPVVRAVLGPSPQERRAKRAVR